MIGRMSLKAHVTYRYVKIIIHMVTNTVLAEPESLVLLLPKPVIEHYPPTTVPLYLGITRRHFQRGSTTKILYTRFLSSS
jgi:hypothetical protein